MKKTELLQLLRCTQAELAHTLGITQSAIAQWDDVPHVHMMRLRYELMPDFPWPKEKKRKLTK